MKHVGSFFVQPSVQYPVAVSPKVAVTKPEISLPQQKAGLRFAGPQESVAENAGDVQSAWADLLRMAGRLLRPEERKVRFAEPIETVPLGERDETLAINRQAFSNFKMADGQVWQALKNLQERAETLPSGKLRKSIFQTIQDYTGPQEQGQRSVIKHAVIDFLNGRGDHYTAFSKADVKCLINGEVGKLRRYGQSLNAVSQDERLLRRQTTLKAIKKAEKALGFQADALSEILVD
jgi:hypothetical protein